MYVCMGVGGVCVCVYGCWRCVCVHMYMCVWVLVMCVYVFALSTEKKLKEIEQNHCISLRWKPSDREYQEMEEQALLGEKKEQLLLAIWKAAKRRAFLLKLKAKYAGRCLLVASISETSKMLSNVM